MAYSLALQNTYQTVELALFNDTGMLELVSADKSQASKQLIPLISTLLTTHQLNFNQLDFIAVNQGPGPFTTLRVIIATANGLSFASAIPLIGIDGMQALIEEYRSPEYEIIIALLDAFNEDVYFAVRTNDTIITSGYKKYHELIPELAANYAQAKALIIGNAALLYEMPFRQALPRAQINAQASTCALEQINTMAYHKWRAHEGMSHQLFPLYLKTQQYKNHLGQIKTI